jgi:hypothetical protein
MRKSPQLDVEAQAENAGAFIDIQILAVLFMLIFIF